MAKQTFTSGQVLTASQMNTLQTNDYNMTVTTGTASYTLQASDVGQRRVQNMGSAGTVTVPNSVFTAGDALWLHSIGSGVQTIAAGAGLTLNSSAGTAPTLAQWEGGVVYFTSASAAIFFRSGSRNTLNVEFLLVGGGGAGGGNSSIGTGATGGGGGGGFVTGSGIIGKTTYTVKVGAGGVGSGGSQGRSGTQSSFINSATGGGGGGARGENGAAVLGGSGGGAGDSGAGNGISGEGNNGGTANTASGGGGGGAGAVGGNASSSTSAGNGGAGSSNNYDGVTTTYAGGGGGGGSGATTAAGTGGTGGGGAGAQTGTATAGTANTGGGGGGGRTGGNGGSGVVIVRWLTADATGFSISVTGTTTNGTDGSYTWYKWTSTGTLVVA